MTQQKIYKEVSSYLKKGTKFLDVRHIVTLAWMIAAVIGSKSVNQAEWGSYVQSRAQKEDSNQKRWRRFLNNGRVKGLCCIKMAVVSSFHLRTHKLLFSFCHRTLKLTGLAICIIRLRAAHWINSSTA